MRNKLTPEQEDAATLVRVAGKRWADLEFEDQCALRLSRFAGLVRRDLESGRVYLTPEGERRAERLRE